MMHAIRTPAQAKAWIESQGKTVKEFAEANGELYLASLIQLGLILFFITFVVLSCSKLLLLRLKKQEGRAS